MWIEYNPNPNNRKGSDCVYRAISKATGKTWDEIYWDLAILGAEMGDAPVANAVWAAYLKSQGYKRRTIPDNCPDCYTVKEFAADHPLDTFILGTGTHAVTVQNGNYYDAWDSGNEIPIYYWRKAHGL